MNKRKIVSFIGRIILIEAALMVLPLLVALYYGDGDAWVFAVTILAALIPGVLMARVRQSDTQQQGWILYRGGDLDHHFPDRCHAAVYGRGIPFLLECPV